MSEKYLGPLFINWMLCRSCELPRFIMKKNEEAIDKAPAMSAHWPHYIIIFKWMFMLSQNVQIKNSWSEVSMIKRYRDTAKIFKSSPRYLAFLRWSLNWVPATILYYDFNIALYWALNNKFSITDELKLMINLTDAQKSNLKETYHAFLVCSCPKIMKVKKSELNAPLSHRKHCSWSTSSVVTPSVYI